MKPKNHHGVACTLLETDMKHSKPLDKNSLSELQKQYLLLLPENEQINILAGQGAVVIDLEQEDKEKKVICSFNMDNYKPPQSNIDAFARAIVPDIQEFYSHEENRKAFEKWQAKQKKSPRKK